MVSLRIPATKVADRNVLRSGSSAGRTPPAPSRAARPRSPIVLRAPPGNAARHKPWGQQKALVVSVVPATPQTLVDDVKPEEEEPDHDRPWSLCTQDTPNRRETPFQPKHDRKITTSALNFPRLSGWGRRPVKTPCTGGKRRQECTPSARRAHLPSMKARGAFWMSGADSLDDDILLLLLMPFAACHDSYSLVSLRALRATTR
jgi:hypothetical protein